MERALFKNSSPFLMYVNQKSPVMVIFQISRRIYIS